jgi:ABC-type oligopeptide transport system substrate-binding subunit
MIRLLFFSLAAFFLFSCGGQKEPASASSEAPQIDSFPVKDSVVTYDLKIRFLLFNSKNSTFNDPLVRRAFFEAIDYVDSDTFSLYYNRDPMKPKNWKYYATQPYLMPYIKDANPLSAVEHLKKTTFKKGENIKDIELLMSSGGTSSEVKEVHYQNRFYKNLKCQISLHVMPETKATERILSGDFAITSLMLETSSTEPFKYMRILSRKGRAINLQPEELAPFIDPRFAETLTAGRQASTPEKQQQIAQNLISLLLKNHHIIPMSLFRYNNP